MRDSQFMNISHENIKIKAISDNPIFIVGAPRSGTTLLQYMLRSHRNLYFPTGESHFFIPIYEKRHQYGDLSRPENIRNVLQDMYRKSREFLETDLHGIPFDMDRIVHLCLENEARSIQDIFATLYRANAAELGKCRWGEKTPWYLLQMRTILEMFPRAQFIHIIRDGRDAALSMFTRKLDFGVYNVFCAAEYWAKYVERGQQFGNALSGDTYLELRYEDLLEDPETSVKDLCKFLDEPFDAGVINYKRPSASPTATLLKNGLTSVHVNRWKKEFSERQVYLFESVAGDILRNNGYETGHRDRTRFLDKLIYRMHNSFCNLVYRKRLVSIR